MMNTIQKQVRVVLSPSQLQYVKIRSEFFDQTGSTNYYDNSDLWDSLVKSSQTEWLLDEITFTQAQCFAESIRIAHPDQCVSICNYENNSYIGNTSWNDQVKMFWEYQVYSEEGKAIMLLRKLEAIQKNLVASWE